MAANESICLSADVQPLSARTPEHMAKTASKYIITEIFPRRRDLDIANCSKIYSSWLHISKALSSTVDEKVLIQLLVDAVVLLKKFSGDPIIANFINKQEEGRPGVYCMEPGTTFVAAVIEATIMHYCPSQAAERDIQQQMVVKKFSSAPFKLSPDSLHATLTDIQVVVGSPLFTRHDSVQAEGIASQLARMSSSRRRRFKGRRDLPDNNSGM
ncbi:hypothetical protein D9619_004145 [Psilocybe cf. subviscida]|uniref:Uncharacterized protein n=1 Tax=Psilocybe cf. subviscida TaxID=2480587 RepID=A0A8H5BPC4_9AGAR|nr:hypothetical protein D9619_004145 [Psilocybe cf. subviscida]